MGRKKKEGTVVVSVRMPIYLYDFFKKQAAKRETTTNAIIVSYLEASTCALEKEEMKKSYQEWLKEEYKKKLERQLTRAKQKDSDDSSLI